MDIGAVPMMRVDVVADRPVRPEGDYVIYWMVAARRTGWNFALDRARDLGEHLGRPVLIFEALRAGYRWASDRLHTFVLQGMQDNAVRCAAAGVTYLPYVEARPGDGAGLLDALAERACAVVTDEFPCFFLPRMVRAAGERLEAAGVRLEQVDGNGLLPLRASDRAFPTAHGFRHHVHRTLPMHIVEGPDPDPLPSIAALGRAPVPASVTARWPAAPPDQVRVEDLEIDHDVRPVELRGGAAAGARCLDAFLGRRLRHYADERNEPARPATSGLSPYLHFGHVSAHQVFDAVSEWEGWMPTRLGRPSGKRAGWWGMSAPAEAFLDELVIWREVGYGFCHHRPDDYHLYASLPAWARTTLAEHAEDPRPALYTLEQLDAAATHDEIWNAAQTELRESGRMHNYLRMLWGKKVLEWSPDPETAIGWLIELNNRYALDGRDPNSYSGIFWTFGRFDRAWGPERPIFGKIRYMSSDNTRRKLKLQSYLDRWSGQPRLM